MAITRRSFLKGALALAGTGMSGALAVPGLKTLLPPPVVHCNPDEAHDTLTYKGEEGSWYESLEGKVALKEDFQLNQSAMVMWAPKELEEELGSCKAVLTLVKVPAEDTMTEWGVPDDGGNTMMMAYHTYKCPHLCCKPVFKKEGTGISGDPFENMFLCPCHLSRFDPLSIIENIDEKGRPVMVAELVEGPAPYGLPIVPLDERSGELVGKTDKLEWLKYCGLG